MKVSVPTRWEDITIRQYTEVKRIRETITDPVQRAIETIASVTGLDRETVEQISIDGLRELYKKLSFITKDQIEAKQLKEKLSIKGVEYNACLDLRKMSAGQYIDFKDFASDKNEIEYNIHNILAVFFIPKGHKYNKVPVTEVAEVFYDNVTIDVAYPLAVFFWKVYNALTVHMLRYSEEKIVTSMKEMTEILSGGSRNIGAGYAH